MAKVQRMTSRYTDNISISAPFLTPSTTRFSWIESNATTLSWDLRSSGSSHTWQGDLNSFDSTAKLWWQWWSLPWGSVLGPILFIAYSAEVIGIVEQQGFNVHVFSDDLQVYGDAAQYDEHCSPSYSDVHVHQERQGMDDFQPTSS